MIPAVQPIEINGLLPQPLSAPNLVHVMGCCSSGPSNTVARYGRLADLQAVHGRGPAVELAAVQIQAGRQVSFTRLPSATAGAAGAVDAGGSNTSTSVVTVTGTPDLDYSVVVTVSAGGTIGISGCKIKYSLNGGGQTSGDYSLLTANTFAIPGTALTLHFAAGTLVAGDTFSFDCTAPAWDSSGLGAGLDLLRTKSDIDCVQVAGTMSPTDFGTFDSKLVGHKPYGKHLWGLCEWRVPNSGESLSDYNTAFEDAFNSKASDTIGICKGGYLTVSAVDGTEYVRSPLYGGSVVATPASISENPAAINNHNLSLVRLTNDAGDQVGQDALFDSTLADRAITLRSHAGHNGVYICLARLWSSPSSSYRLLMHRRIVNRAEQVCDKALSAYLNMELFANDDGTIRDDEAQKIESDVRDQLGAELDGFVSKFVFTIDRTVLLTSTSRVEADLYILPKGYAETIKVRIALVAKIESSNA